MLEMHFTEREKASLMKLLKKRTDKEITTCKALFDLAQTDTIKNSFDAGSCIRF